MTPGADRGRTRAGGDGLNTKGLAVDDYRGRTTEASQSQIAARLGWPHGSGPGASVGEWCWWVVRGSGALSVVMGGVDTYVCAREESPI